MKYRTVAELDGNAAHPIEHRERDRARDNAVVESAQVTLRYGWRAVAGNPCLTAAQVGRVLASRGWLGRVKRCGQGVETRQCGTSDWLGPSEVPR